tara:strand:- start:898 stop:1110 length:213 start_codon:yes stop_codon:yes gene_type:complete
MFAQHKTWQNVTGYKPDPSEHREKARVNAKGKLSQLSSRLTHSQPFIVKDPRFCLTLETVLEVQLFSPLF